MSLFFNTLRYFITDPWISEQPLSTSIFRLDAIDTLAPLRRRLNSLEVHNAAQAHLICRLIPAQCPFARPITILGHILFTIPPLCKFNPLYQELMVLRFRALSYLADECHEDIRQYC